MAGTEAVIEESCLLAIGRGLNPAWLEHLADVASHVLPETIGLKLRKQPGLVYVPSDKILGIPGAETVSDDERKALVEGYAQSVVKSLSDEHMLDSQLALDGVDLPLHRPVTLSTKKFKPVYSPLSLSVGDVPLNLGEEYNYQVDCERGVFAEKFDGDNDTPPDDREQPRHRVILGLIGSGFSRRHLTRIERELTDPVPFLSIDVLDLSLTEVASS